ncbi:MAG: efflux RND transporter periplasmic adaptor subunit [Proteobacteria bacterium]|nr:efflux RND transporter periplasmic adaptor subunit [Pseudomonadota bacterium]
MMTVDSDTGDSRRRALLIAAGLGVLGLIVWALHHSRQGAAAPPGASRPAGAHGGFAGGGPVPVRVVAARTGTVDVTVDALGTVTALNTATIHSRVDGPLLQVPFREGQVIPKGGLLAQIDPSTFRAARDQAAGQLARDQSQLAGARVDLNRYTGLLAKDAIASQTVDQQKFLVKQLEGAVRADEAAVENARLQLAFTRVTAPFTGRAGLRQVDPGNMIHAGDASGLVVLTQTRPIYVLFAVPSQHLSAIYPQWSHGQALPVQALDRDGKVIASGHLAAVDNQIDTTTGTIRLKAQFANEDDALFPSQFVTARLRIGTVTDATLVPSVAIQRGAPGTYLYVVNADNSVSLRISKPGPSNTAGDLTSIEDGVKPGERVVIDGLDKLRDGTTVSVIDDSKADVAPAQGGTAAYRHGGRHGGVPAAAPAGAAPTHTAS